MAGFDVDDLPIEDELKGSPNSLTPYSTPIKANLNIGSFQDGNRRPWVLTSVKKDKQHVHDDSTSDDDYHSIDGDCQFIEHARQLLFGDNISSSRISSIQTVNGTDATDLGARLMFETLKPKTVWMSDQYWQNRSLIWERPDGSVKCCTYPNYDVTTNSLDFQGMIDYLNTSAHPGDIVILNGHADDPSGMNFLPEWWEQLIKTCHNRELYPFFDLAHQGYTADEHNLIAPFFWRFAQRYTNMSFCVAQSFFTKSGVYEERVGVFHLITNSVAQVCAVLARVEHGEISSPPLFGSQIIKRILDNEALRNQWNKDLLTMNARLVSIRWALWNNLDNLDSPGVWQAWYAFVHRARLSAHGDSTR